MKRTSLTGDWVFFCFTGSLSHASPCVGVSLSFEWLGASEPKKRIKKHAHAHAHAWRCVGRRLVQFVSKKSLEFSNAHIRSWIASAFLSPRDLMNSRLSLISVSPGFLARLQR